MDARCELAGCGKDEKAHRYMAHQFQQGDVATLEIPRQNPFKGQIAADPVLRILLIRKGFITRVELTGIEDELKAAGLLGGRSGTNPTDGAGNRKVRDNPQA